MFPRNSLPFGAFAYDEMPRQEPVVIHNATIWTNTDEGVIENGYVIFRDGKIERVASGEPGGLPRIYRWIDAEGRHVTPGMLDCHSHTGIDGGVNEGTQAVTAEVAIYDVIDPDDINWYRQLAGGVTGVNQLHGSANPIGGQNSVVKLRWGVEHPDDMRMGGARAASSSRSARTSSSPTGAATAATRRRAWALRRPSSTRSSPPASMPSAAIGPVAAASRSARTTNSRSSARSSTAIA
ncbi:MAG: hypothetical protein ACFHWZ_01100 [Phycisphaerales bacterium]